LSRGKEYSENYITFMNHLLKQQFLSVFSKDIFFFIFVDYNHRFSLNVKD